MNNVYNRALRAQRSALAGVSVIVLILAFALSYSRANAAPARSAAAGPKLSALKVIPASPIRGHGFQVSFKTTSGGDYVVFYSTGQNGGPLVMGSTKAGKVTTKKLGKDLHAGSYTIGVDLTKNKKTKRVTIKMKIKNK